MKAVTKKSNIKKSVSILLPTVFLGLSLAGCGGATSTPQASTSPSGQPAAGGAKPTIKLLVPNNVEEFPSGSDVNNNEIVNAIREKTGYNTQWELLPKDAEAARQKLNVLMASGDTPDIIVIGDKPTFGSFLQQGLLTPLDPLLDEVGPNIKGSLTPEQWKSASYDGKIYAIRTVTFNTPTKGLMARKDWLDAAGIKEPKTLDEFYAALKALKEKKPDAVPFGGALAQGGGDLTSLEAIAGAFGQAVDYSATDGKVVYNPVTDDAKEFLTFANKLYSEGLLDKESLVNKNDNLKEKLVSGKAAMSTIGWPDAKTIDDALKSKEPNSKLVYIDPPTGKNGMSGVAKATSTTKYFVIPKFSKNAKEAIKFLNKISEKEIIDYISFGEEGKHYNKKDGQFIATKEAESIRYRVYYNLFDTVELGTQRMQQKGFAPYFEPTIKYSKYENVLDMVPPIEAVDKKTKELLDLKKEYYLKIISGALPLTAFDEYVSKWKKAGGEEVLKALNDAYNVKK
ncbi:extracellular solute-binding protein [Paenibacillus agricola]|uniref:Extracellular solute-binding protein n=1 Tax=Paenibacillus agricola TaxID=2716264 RepID=A0ABX0J7X5_9BACL|nr:extracellular solute-binding protein [Paenibacillus agricola]NHN31911.1 extracellular solute-binding protein [Paenibacillus agricola]